VSAVDELRVEVPPEIQTGVYANAASVRHTPFEFTLDFLCIGIEAAARPENPDHRPTAPVVARLKVPINKDPAERPVSLST
jgi:hypothetical protein